MEDTEIENSLRKCVRFAEEHLRKANGNIRKAKKAFRQDLINISKKRNLELCPEVISAFLDLIDLVGIR